MAKKKKPASNPNRGFSTVSVASKKTATEDQPDLGAATASQSSSTLASSSISPSQDSNDAISSQDSVEATVATNRFGLTANDLQMRRKTAAAQYQRVLRQHRVAKATGRPIDLTAWLPDELKTELCRTIDLLASNELLFSFMSGAAESVRLERLRKLWFLEDTLSLHGFSAAAIRSALSWVGHTVRSDQMVMADQQWGYTPALEFMASSFPDLPLWSSGRFYKYIDQSDDWNGVGLPPKPRPIAPAVVESTPAVSTAEQTEPDRTPDDHDDGYISAASLSSTLEPEELVPRWIDLKSRIFAIELSQHMPPSKRKTRLARLNRLVADVERDYLFDSAIASSAWMRARANLHLKLQESRREKKLAVFPGPDSEWEQVEEDEMLMPDPGSISDDPDLDLFEQLAVSPAEPASKLAGLQRRQFDLRANRGGSSPREVLQTHLRTLNGTARFIPASPMTGAHQTAVDVERDVAELTGMNIHEISGFRFFRLDSGFRAEMTDVYCSSREESGGYAAAVTLAYLAYFDVASNKLYMRLSTLWKSVWDDTTAVLNDISISRAVEDISLIEEEVSKMHPASDAAACSEKTTSGAGTALPTTTSKATSTTATRSNNDTVPRWGSTTHPSQLQAIWSHYESTPTFQAMIPGRVELPVNQFKTAILSVVESNPVVLISGETGCGKSTQIPAYLLENELKKGRECKIVCAQPRRISAVSLANRVRDELGESNNPFRNRSLVGYSVRFENDISPQARIIYSTIGIVFRMLESDMTLQDVTHLVLDEVHERNLDSDFLLLMMKEIRDRRPDLKLILMSATVDTNRFSAYMGDCPVFEVPGRTFPVRHFFLADAIEMSGHARRVNSSSRAVPVEKSGGKGYFDNESDESDTERGGPLSEVGYSTETTDFLADYNQLQINYSLIADVIRLLVSPTCSLGQYSRAILVFLPGKLEIQHCLSALMNADFWDPAIWHPFILHSAVTTEDQQKAFQPVKDGHHKVILATNIAETGITIPDITCVIDSGKHKEMRYNERRQTSRLTETFISKANARQRRGRAGRTQEGICFHLFTEFRHNTLMASFPIPEVQRLSLKELISRVVFHRLGRVADVLAKLLDAPSEKSIQHALKALVEANILSVEERLTPIGHLVLRLPVDTPLAKLVIFSALVGCLDFGLTTAALLSARTLISKPAPGRSNSIFDEYATTDCDITSLFNLYQAWKRSLKSGFSSSSTFCRRNNINQHTLAEVEEVKQQLLIVLSELGLTGLTPAQARQSVTRDRSSGIMIVALPTDRCSRTCNQLLLRSIIGWAFYPNLLFRSSPTKTWCSLTNPNAQIKIPFESVNHPSKTPAPIDDTSALPSLLSFHNLHDSRGSSYANFTTVIDPVAMAVFLPFFTTSTISTIPSISPSLSADSRDPIRFLSSISTFCLTTVSNAGQAVGQLRESTVPTSTSSVSSTGLVLRFVLPSVCITTQLHTVRMEWNRCLEKALGGSHSSRISITKTASAGDKTAGDLADEPIFQLAMHMFDNAYGVGKGDTYPILKFLKNN